MGGLTKDVFNLTFEIPFSLSIEEISRYTGSGKTHTVLGSGGEEGLYYKVGGCISKRSSCPSPLLSTS